MKIKIISILLTLSLLLSASLLFSACTPEEDVNDTQDTSDSSNDSTKDSSNDSESGSDSESESEEIYLEPDPVVDFITYNVAFYEATAANMTVMYEGQSLSDYTIAKRAPRLASLVEHYMPDVMALQEVNRLWWPYIVSNEDSIINTFGYEWAGNQGGLKSKNGKSTIDNDLYNLLLWNPDKFEEIDSGVFRLDSKFYGEANKDRQCTWAILKNKTTGTETLFASTHLCTRGNDVTKALNLAQAQVLTEKLKVKADGRTIILGGDFNANSSSPSYTHITKTENFSDPRTVAKTILTPNMSSSRVWGKTTNWKTGNNAIDHILFYGKTYIADTYTILHDTFDKDNVISQDMSKVGINYDLSDHLGVFTRFVERGY